MSSSWEEVQIVQKENRRELMLHGSVVNKKIEEGGLDVAIFDLINLNNLKIAGTPIESISEKIGSLNNLTALSLQNNHLKLLPETIGSLKLMKTLDISGNQLTELPNSLTELTNLQTLNANLNELTTFPNVSNFKNLSYLYISRNQLTSLPDGITDASLKVLNTIEANNNNITELPSDLSNLPLLTKLNVVANKLETLPLDLCESHKLKELLIGDNKMKDRKMLKLADHSTKSLLAYLGTLLSKQKATDSRGKKENHKSKQKKKKDAMKDKEEEKDVISVHQFVEENGVSVSVTDAVLSVRQYIVCCVLKNLNFSKSKNMFKNFISLQTKLHDTVCEKRQASTIATHDMRFVKQPLVYDAAIPGAIQITPLFKTKTSSAEELVKILRDEAEAIRKEKKKNTLSGVHKYLDLLKDKTHYPCLRDAEGDVLSFPPITNSEKSKISTETTDILVEVTSSISLDICKKTMEALLAATLLTGVGTPSSAEDETEASMEPGTQSLTVQQVKINDPEGHLRVIYPSRVDLESPNFNVIRNYE